MSVSLPPLALVLKEALPNYLFFTAENAEHLLIASNAGFSAPSAPSAVKDNRGCVNPKAVV